MISGFADKVENGLKNCLADFKGKKVISHFYPKDMTLNFIHWNPDPEIINIFGISVRYYGLLFVSGLILCIFSPINGLC